MTLVRWYRFNESSGTTAFDYSGNNVNATYPTSNFNFNLSGPTSDQKACQTTIDQQFSLPSVPEISTAQKYTVTFWYKVPSAISWSTASEPPYIWQYPMRRGSTGMLFAASQEKIFYYRPPGTGSTSGTSVSVTPGNWQHMGWAYDTAGKEQYYWRDGVLEGGYSTTGFFPSISNTTFILFLQSLNNFFGFISDVRIYDTAFTQSEIIADMNTIFPIAFNELWPLQATSVTSPITGNTNNQELSFTGGYSLYSGYKPAQFSTANELEFTNPIPLNNFAIRFVSYINQTTGTIFKCTDGTETIELKFDTTLQLIGTNGATTVYSGSYTNAQIAYDQWHYFVIVHDGTDLRFYVDGVLFDTLSPLASSITASGDTTTFNSVPYISHIRLVIGSFSAGDVTSDFSSFSALPTSVTPIVPLVTPSISNIKEDRQRKCSPFIYGKELASLRKALIPLYTHTATLKDGSTTLLSDIPCRLELQSSNIEFDETNQVFVGSDTWLIYFNLSDIKPDDLKDTSTLTIETKKYLNDASVTTFTAYSFYVEPFAIEMVVEAEE